MMRSVRDAYLNPILMKYSRRLRRILLWVAGLGLLFALFTSGISQNPPGFSIDESCYTYNAYLVAKTGAGEVGPRFPLFFEVFRDGFAQIYHPVHEYLLAIVFLFFPPSILVARMFSAFGIFSTCLLTGLLATRISGRRTIGVIVAAMALVTPWFFEYARLAWETHLVPLLTILYLLWVYRAQGKEKWSLVDITLIVSALALLTYCYASGRALAPLMAAGLVFLVTTRQRVIDVAKTWLFYGLTWVPVFLYSRQHPGALSKRIQEVSYIRLDGSWSEMASHFVKRYLEDQSLTGLLLAGDYHPRHHVQGAGGAIFFATFILALIGIAIVIVRRRSDPWWRFVLYGVAAAVVPGAISVEPFHQSRLLAYPVFLMLLTIPTLEWLLAPAEQKSDVQPLGHTVTGGGWPRWVRLGLLGLLLALTCVETYRFQTVFRREGPKRLYDFDVPYKEAYDLAVKQPARPIYLEDGKWGPAYIHALWYATLENRPISQFVRLKAGTKPPAGAIVISSADTCEHCQTIQHPGVYLVYKAL
jgi:4-amino-4-deoxy-L-arabinose transferase-like glycosyltransferase